MTANGTSNVLDHNYNFLFPLYTVFAYPTWIYTRIYLPGYTWKHYAPWSNGARKQWQFRSVEATVTTKIIKRKNRRAQKFIKNFAVSNNFFFFRYFRPQSIYTCTSCPIYFVLLRSQVTASKNNNRSAKYRCDSSKHSEAYAPKLL